MVMQKALSLFQALKPRGVKKAEAPPNPVVNPTVDISYLQKFSNVSEGLKKEFAKVAGELGCERRDIYDMISAIDKGKQVEKQANYINWLKELNNS